MKLRKHNLLKTNTLLLLLIVIFSSGCSQNYTPKPRGYFRVALPEKSYVILDSVYPYAFEYPKYAHITNDPLSPQEKNWINVNLPPFKGCIHLSYKPIVTKTNLNTYIEDSRTLVFKHMPKSSGINYVQFEDKKNKVYGLIYDIKGATTASPCQFYLTDSAKHFIRGSLYFEAIPNNDSLAPIIQFVKKDIDHLIETLRWKK